MQCSAVMEECGSAHHHHQQVVMKNQDGTVKHPMEINFFLSFILGLLCWFGFPLNFEIIIRIVYDKSMRLKPRYIIQLAIAFSAILLLLTYVIVICHHYFGPNQWVCLIFVSFFMGVPYNCFLLNYLLSLTDCFVAITFPLWHLTEITARPRRLLYALIALNSTMALAVKWQFITGSLPVECAFQPSHGLVTNVTSSVLFLLCLIFCCVDFVITWHHLRRPSSSSSRMNKLDHQRGRETADGDVGPSTPGHRQQEEEEEEEEEEAEQRGGGGGRLSVIQVGATVSNRSDESSSSSRTTSTTSQMTMNYPQSSILNPQSNDVVAGQMEWNATRSFLFGVVPLFLIPLPLFLFYYSFHLICEQIVVVNSASSSSAPSGGGGQLDEVCQDLTWLIIYLFSILLNLHALVNPITSLWLNKDFQCPSPIRRRLLRLSAATFSGSSVISFRRR